MERRSPSARDLRRPAILPSVDHRLLENYPHQHDDDDDDDDDERGTGSDDTPVESAELLLARDRLLLESDC
jgi:hypothetical protein